MDLINKTNFSFAPILGRLNHPRYSLTLIIKGTFDLKQGARVQEAEEQIYPTSEEFYPDDPDRSGSSCYEMDFACFKPKADLLLAGKCHPPGGKALPACQVTFQVGPYKKSLAIFGDRHWKRNALGLGILSDAEPFTEMELRYENSFGGAGYKQNPVGKGYNKESDESGKKVRWLPNIEDPKNLVTAPGNRPDPAGFGPLNRMWKQRQSKRGSYKGDYQKKRWPWFPEDFDWSHFNAAPPDMQVEGYLRGDEKLYFENLHPKHSQYHSQLPGLRVRCFVSKQIRSDSEETRFDEVSMKLDTLWVDMEEEKVLLVWRGWTEVLSEEYEEIEYVFIMSEPLQEKPQTKEQCHTLFLKALEEYEAEWAMPAEEAAAPEPAAEAETETQPAETPKVEQPPELPATPEISKAELTKHIQVQTTALLAQMGLSMERLPPEVRQQVEDQQQRLIAKMTEEDTSKIMAKEREETEAKLREELNKIGIDYDNLPPLSEKAKSEQQRLLQEMGIKDTDISKDETVTKSWQVMAAVMPQMGLDPENLDPLIEHAKPHFEKIRKQLGLEEPAEDTETAEEEPKEPKTKDQEPAAHDQEPKANGQEQDDVEEIDINQRLAAGESLAGMDLSGHDFSKQELSGVDFSGTVLAGAVFGGVNLEGAVLAKADLKKADLSAANLAGANLAGADLRQANLEKANLEGADLTESTLTGSNLKSAQLKDAAFDRAIMTDTVLDQVIATGAMFPEADLSGSSCKQSDLSSADFAKCILNNTDFQGSNLTDATLEGAQGQNINFREANLNKLRASEKCDFTGGNFSKCESMESIWHEADLRGANFTYSKMEGADFSKCNLEKANLSGADIKTGRFVKANLKAAKMIMTNLFQSSMEKADLTGTDLSGSNMYAVEFLEAVTEGTIFQGANLKMTKLTNS